MKMSATRIPLAIALSSALAFAVGCANEADTTAEVDETAEMTPADQTATPPVGPTTADAQTPTDPAMDATADAGMDTNPGLGDGQNSDQPVDDTWITTKVKSSLLAEADVSGLDINVDTLNGVVTLRGEVESQAQADTATRIAREIEGVTNVDASGLTVGAAAE
ncbi:BON domain-containing protein [Luteimonas kalidii]|jgi:hyperosmotically inducible protein|uniref:BON domain-containing protein n=1 Tax=Luteimonas kalidii TaxID=3042025 RepID=A0ABT6JXE3_9GAMM|nr:BON domain-containing protein [Luteimonas kalidii]MDH5835244.1 BON domain-containing protein [Luteimonas kalidii]